VADGLAAPFLPTRLPGFPMKKNSYERKKTAKICYVDINLSEIIALWALK